MTHQSKSYKKFVASAATATLVASAIVPVASAATPSFTDVSKDYKEAVDYIVDHGFAQGTTETTFGTAQNISRGDAAVMIANALNLDTDNAPDAGFQDVNNRVAGAVNAIVEADIASGRTSSKFDPAAYITRQEMAKMLANAYELEAETNAGFTDVNSNWIGFVSALKDAGITLGKTETTFAPEQNLTRGEFALFMFRAETMDVTPVPGELAVDAVSATNANDLKVTLTGKAGEDLVVADFAVTVNGTDAAVSVTKVSATEYTLQLTVPLEDGDVVVVKGAKEVAGSASVTYKTPAVATVDGVEAIVYADKAGQELAVKVNGAVTSVSDLAKRGYTVTFQATENVFGGSNPTTSSTGLLDESQLDALYTADNKSFRYKVSLQKDNEVITSSNVAITISQEDKTAASTIKTVSLSATTAGGAIESLTSDKLVQGETAQIEELIADLQDGRKNVNLVDLTDSNVKYESSDVTIATVDVNGAITAGNRSGKVTITVTSGTQTKDINLEVVSAPRELTTATYNGSAVKLTNGATKVLSFSAKDQYGDIFNTTALNIADIASVEPVANGKVITGAATSIATANDARGTFTATVEAHATEIGAGTLSLNVGSKKIASTTVSVAKETGVVKQTLVKSANQIDLNPAVGSKSITFNLENLFNGYFKENAEFDGLTVEVYDATKPTTPIYTLAGASGDEDLTIHATDLILEDTTVTTVAGLDGTAKTVSVTDVITKSEVGTALVVVKDAAGKEVDKLNFNIVDTSANATSATFNTAVDFTAGNATATLNLGDLITNVATTASPHDGVLRYQVVAGNAYAYYSAKADVAAYDYAQGDILVGVIEGTAVTPTDTVTLAQPTVGKYLANTITVDHSITKDGDKVQFNFYKRGDVSVGKATYTKKSE